jgi:hypothetical protein
VAVALLPTNEPVLASALKSKSAKLSASKALEDPILTTSLPDLGLIIYSVGCLKPNGGKQGKSKRFSSIRKQTTKLLAKKIAASSAAPSSDHTSLTTIVANNVTPQVAPSYTVTTIKPQTGVARKDTSPRLSSSTTKTSPTTGGLCTHPQTEGDFD